MENELLREHFYEHFHGTFRLATVCVDVARTHVHFKSTDVCVSARSSRERINKTCVFTCVLNTAVGVGHQCPACAPVHRQPPFSSFQRRSLFYQHGFLCRCCLAGPFVCVAFWERMHASESTLDESIAFVTRFSNPNVLLFCRYL